MPCKKAHMATSPYVSHACDLLFITEIAVLVDLINEALELSHGSLVAIALAVAIDPRDYCCDEHVSGRQNGQH